MNHSRESANLKPTKVIDNHGDPHIVFMSKRDIGAKEELVFDYGDRDPDALVRCPWLK